MTAQWAATAQHIETMGCQGAAVLRVAQCDQCVTGRRTVSPHVNQAAPFQGIHNAAILSRSTAEVVGLFNAGQEVERPLLFVADFARHDA
jgi:hypothetical protein